jgi:hypothetical protein
MDMGEFYAVAKIPFKDTLQIIKSLGKFVLN